MYAKYSEIQLLLLCIILHNCRSTAIIASQSPSKKMSDQMSERNHRWLSTILPFSYSSTSNNVSNYVKKIDSPDKIESSPLRISLFPTKNSDEEKDEETDNVQQEETQININDDTHSTHVLKEITTQSSDQINPLTQKIINNLSDLALILNDSEIQQAHRRVPRIRSRTTLKLGMA